MGERTTDWHECITEELARHGETWDDVVDCTLSADGLQKKFDPGFGCHEGAAFTAWTHRRVYFPVVYGGSEWVESVSRNPDGVPTTHVGGE
jgi:hypothetical protein